VGAQTEGDRVARPFTGHVEEAALWTRALSDDELRRLARLDRQSPAAELLGPGDHQRTIEVDQRDRSYIIHVPPGYDSTAPAPAVLVFHGGGMNARLMIRFCGMHKKSDEAGFIAVYPNGTGAANLFLAFNAGGLAAERARNRPDDVRFVAALLDDLAGVVNLDAKRVYATGISNGGMMCYRLAAELSDRIAAIAPVAGTVASDVDRPRRAVPVMHFHGTADRIVPLGGPGERSPPFLRFKGVDESVRLWARLNGCPEEPAVAELPDTEDDGTRVTRRLFGPGTDGAEVVLYLIEGGGHTWPGEKSPLALVGKSTADISANDLMWEFFQRFSLK
jgi:polyhydroxybutyrate depolymerase